MNRFYFGHARNWASFSILDRLVKSDPNKYSKNYPSISSLLEKYGSKLGEIGFTQLKGTYEESVRKSMAYAPGSPMPAFLLKKLDGDMLNTNKRSGKPILYDIWASWCGPCLRNFPKVHELEEKYEDKLEVVSLSLDKREEDHSNMLKKMDVPGSKHLWTEGEFDSDFAKFFQMESLPAYLLVSAEGKILKFGNWGEVKEIFENTVLLGE